MKQHFLAGVYAAVVTPLKADYTLDSDGLILLLQFLAQRGCHGALLLGTTGEGPSFSAQEREEILRVGVKIRESQPAFRLLAGTGTPSLEETIGLTKTTFDLGYDASVVLPPYYFRNASEEGLYAWFGEVIQRAVPKDGAILGYHIPRVSGVSISPQLISRLKEAFPNRFAGLKDSSANLDHAALLGNHFGQDLVILNGTDSLLTKALQAGASGCITAMGNLISPDLRRVWNAHQEEKTVSTAQARLNAAREIWEQFPPAASLVKMLLAHLYNFPRWAVKPPLLPIPEDVEARAISAWKTRGKVV